MLLIAIKLLSNSRSQYYRITPFPRLSLRRYFMLMFGLNDVYSLVLGESSEMDEANRMMQMQMGGMMGQQPGFDAAGMYRQVATCLS